MSDLLNIYSNPPHREVVHSMKRRSNWHNYSKMGTYMLTLVVSGRHPLLGSLPNATADLATVPSDSVRRSISVSLTPLGKAIRDQEIPQIQQHYPMVEVWSACIMPDHIHMIIRVKEDLPQGIHLGKIVAGFKYGCTSRATELLGTVASLQHERNASNLATVPSDSVRRSASALFESGYNDKILRFEDQLDNWKKYLNDNPRRLYIKRQHPDLFRICRHVELSGMTFSALGNHFLLDYPDKQVVECSRSLMSQQIDALAQEVLAHAENGAVTISAAISEGERRIAKAVREAGFPLVVLLKDGFPAEGSDAERYYKPGGIYFETCAAGKLLLLEPTAETFVLPAVQDATESSLRQKAEAKHLTYSPLPTTSTRYRFIALNEMAKML